MGSLPHFWWDLILLCADHKMNELEYKKILSVNSNHLHVCFCIHIYESYIFNFIAKPLP